MPSLDSQVPTLAIATVHVAPEPAFGGEGWALVFRTERAPAGGDRRADAADVTDADRAASGLRGFVLTGVHPARADLSSIQAQLALAAADAALRERPETWTPLDRAVPASGETLVGGMTVLPAAIAGEPGEPIGVYAILATDRPVPEALRARVGPRPADTDEGTWLSDLASARGPFLAELLHRAALDQAVFHLPDAAVSGDTAPTPA